MDANNRKVNAHGVAAEPDRVRTSVAVGLGIVLAGSCVAAVFVTLALFRRYENRAEAKDRVSIASAGLERREDAAPPRPRLQVKPVKHWKDFRAAEIDRLSTYGWMDRSSGTVRLPIERAMELVAERGVGPLATAPVVVPPAPPAGVKK